MGTCKSANASRSTAAPKLECCAACTLLHAGPAAAACGPSSTVPGRRRPFTAAIKAHCSLSGRVRTLSRAASSSCSEVVQRFPPPLQARHVDFLCLSRRGCWAEDTVEICLPGHHAAKQSVMMTVPPHACKRRDLVNTSDSQSTALVPISMLDGPECHAAKLSELTAFVFIGSLKIKADTQALAMLSSTHQSRRPRCAPANTIVGIRAMPTWAKFAKSALSVWWRARGTLPHSDTW